MVEKEADYGGPCPHTNTNIYIYILAHTHIHTHSLSLSLIHSHSHSEILTLLVPYHTKKPPFASHVFFFFPRIYIIYKVIFFPDFYNKAIIIHTFTFSHESHTYGTTIVPRPQLRTYIYISIYILSRPERSAPC